jgi:hypothetical protein
MMTDEFAGDLARIGTRLLNEAYTMWRAAETECEEALRGWSGRTGRGGAEAAAHDLQKLHEMTQSYPSSRAPSESRAMPRADGGPERFQ